MTPESYAASLWSGSRDSSVKQVGVALEEVARSQARTRIRCCLRVFAFDAGGECVRWVRFPTHHLPTIIVVPVSQYGLFYSAQTGDKSD